MLRHTLQLYVLHSTKECKPQSGANERLKGGSIFKHCQGLFTCSNAHHINQQACLGPTLVAQLCRKC